jgi:hypothetical protein
LFMGGVFLLLGLINTLVNSEPPSHPAKVVLVVLGLLLWATAGVWFLLAPSVRSMVTMYTAIALGFAMLVAAQVLALVTGEGIANSVFLGLFAFLGLIISSWFAFCNLREYKRLKQEWDNPPPPEDIKAVEDLACDVLSANPEHDTQIVEYRGESGRGRLRLSDVYVDVGKKARSIALVRKDEIEYAIQSPLGARGISQILLWPLSRRNKAWVVWVAFYRRGQREDIEAIGISPAALDRLQVWKPPAANAVLERTIWLDWHVRIATAELSAKGQEGAR